MLNLHAYDDNLARQGCQYPVPAVLGDRLAVPQDGSLLSSQALIGASTALCPVCRSPLIYITGVDKCAFCLGLPESSTGAKRQRTARQVYVKCRDGILVAQHRGLHVRTFVLSQSDYAWGMGLDYDRAWKCFQRKFRRDYGRDTGMAYIEHVQDTGRTDRHIVAWGEKRLNLNDLNEYWLKVYGSFVSWRKKHQGGMLIANAHEEAKYFSRYARHEGFQRAHFSDNWVFPAWHKYCKWARKTLGDYPSIQELAWLAGQDAFGRLAHSRYRDWYATQQDRLKQVWADKIIGARPEEAVWLADLKRRRGKA